MIPSLKIFIRRALSVASRKEGSMRTAEEIGRSAPEKYEKITKDTCIQCEPKPFKKVVTTAIIGNSNAGKSTLINTIMDMHICGASKKQHTTLKGQWVFNVYGDTEIQFLDTPGVLSRKESKRFKFKKEADINRIDDIRSVDVVTVLIDSTCKFTRSHPGGNLLRFLKSLPSHKKFVLIFNKVDLVKNKRYLLKFITNYTDTCSPVRRIPFSRIFLMSALKNDGVDDFVDYLVSQAREPPDGEGVLTNYTKHAVENVVKLRVKACLLDHCPQEVPYASDCEVEYISKNAKGELFLCLLIKCRTKRHLRIIEGKDNTNLRKMTEECRNDFMKLFGCPVFVDMIPALQNKKLKVVK